MPNGDGAIYPLRVAERFSRRVWGGDRLPAYLGSSTQGSGVDPVAEAWLVYTDNEIRNGTFSGRSLGEVAATLRQDLLGTASVARYGARVPLLAKLIDAAAPLSVQVHPDDAYALTHEAASGHLGKSEAWYVLEADAGAHVLWGFRRELTVEEVRRAVGDGTLPDLMNRVEVRPGDVIYNPAGTVHAIGAGILLFEIQQSSDLTYRLYDYQRLDGSGRPRALHLDQALQVADLSGGERARIPARQLGPGHRRLLSCEHFTMDAVTLETPFEGRTDASSLQLVTATRGTSRLRWSGGVEDLARGASLVLPAALGGYRLEGEQGSEILVCAVTPPNEEPGVTR